MLVLGHELKDIYCELKIGHQAGKGLQYGNRIKTTATDKSMATNEDNTRRNGCDNNKSRTSGVTENKKLMLQFFIKPEVFF